MSRTICPATALVAVLIAGIVHGFWSGRWTDESHAVSGQASLDRIPLQLGDWQGEDLPPQPRGSEPLLGKLSRIYRNRKTRATVTISLIFGRRGPVSIHTPDVCYDASGYKVATPQRFSPQGASAEFFQAEAIKEKAADQTMLRIFWTWNAGGRWQVADNPRVAFARHPVLCKLYLVRELTALGEPVDEDPCLELFGRLLPELEKVTAQGL
jgi:hypothetical protein